MERPILAFVGMFLSPLDYGSSLCGLAFPAVWGRHHVGIGVIMRTLGRFSPQGYTCHPNAEEKGSLYPSFPGDQLPQEPSELSCFKAQGGPAGPRVSRAHLGTTALQRGRTGPGEDKDSCGFPCSRCFPRIPQMEQLRTWAFI